MNCTIFLIVQGGGVDFNKIYLFLDFNKNMLNSSRSEPYTFALIYFHMFELWLIYCM